MEAKIGGAVDGVFHGLACERNVESETVKVLVWSVREMLGVEKCKLFY